MYDSNEYFEIADYIGGIDDADGERDIAASTSDHTPYRKSPGIQISTDDTVFNHSQLKAFRESILADFKPREIDPQLRSEDMEAVLLAELFENGLAGNQTRGMNHLYEGGLRQIVTKLFKIAIENMENKRDTTDEDREIKDISCEVTFTSVRFTRPTTMKYRTSEMIPLTPNLARTNNMTYFSLMYVDAKIEAKATLNNGTQRIRTDEIRDFRIASVPVMVKSKLCNLYDKTREQLKALEEDPNDPGGYFIIKGVEWSVDMIENILINGFQIHRNMYQNEIARGQMISKPGDNYENSFQLIVRYLNNGAITIELTLNKDEKLDIPFYLLFRMFGMTQDREIIDNIVYGVDNRDAITSNMLGTLATAFECEEPREWSRVRRSCDINEIITEAARIVYKPKETDIFEKNEDVRRYYMEKLMTTLDRYILPHIGLDRRCRIRKLRFIGHMIHRLLLVEMKVSGSTDRDAYPNKRLHTAGVSLSKLFKTHFNFVVVQEIKKQLKHAFETTPFSQVQLVDTVRGSIKLDELDRVLTQSITTGVGTNLSSKKQDLPNRISSQKVYRKNNLNMIQQLNIVTTGNSSASKQNERADDMRRVHPTYHGYICVAHSKESGETVGLGKLLAVSASICEATSSYFLKNVFAGDPDFIPLDAVSPAEITSRKLTKIFVNGDWIGFCEHSHQFVKRYRIARRFKKIDPTTSIVWEFLLREVYFWVDVGRVKRPLIIVYNNIGEIETAVARRETTIPAFKQWILLTRDHLIGLRTGRITMEDLRDQRVIEYITSEEQTNMYLAENIDTLRENSTNILRQFTHCDIDQAILGITALCTPCGGHAPGSRVTMNTGYKKQSCGWFSLNWPYRIDKNAILQYYCDYPMSKTSSDTFVYPNSQNVILAYALYTGFNQEDSGIVNRSAIERGLFNGSRFHYEETEIEKGEMVGEIDRARTKDVKSNAIYAYCEDGIIKKGTIVRNNYVLVSKYIKITKPTNNNMLFIDRSMIYKNHEPAIVVGIVRVRNEEDSLIIKIRLRFLRNLKIGDKVASRGGNKSIICAVYDQSDMPYAEDGLVPDMIANPHSLPTRMVTNQIIEGLMGLLAVRKGSVLDATTFHRVGITDIIEELRRDHGVNFGGYRRLFNGKTGEHIDTLIFIVPTGYNRIQRMVMDGYHALNNGPTLALTRQPLEGKSMNGGMRLGEMELDTFMSHGAMRSLHEKIRNDSDGIEAYFCNNCGTEAVVNQQENIFMCNICKDNADIQRVHSTWVSQALFFREIEAMNVKPLVSLEKIRYSVSDV